MWCKQCQQDVAAVPQPETGGFCCPRCGEGLPISFPSFGNTCPAVARVEPAHDGVPQPAFATTPIQSPSSDAGQSQAVSENSRNTVVEVCAQAAPDTFGLTKDDTVACGSAAVDPPPQYNEWELEEQLRHVERVLGISAAAKSAVASADDEEKVRFDPPHAGPPGWRGPSRRKKLAGSGDSPPRSRLSGLSAVIWTILSLGLTTFACGGALVSWCYLGERPDLWPIGAPLALMGGIAVVIGLILLIDNLGEENRRTAARVEHVDQRLNDLRVRASGGPGARPRPRRNESRRIEDAQQLLAELKSQLDLLARKIDRR